MIGRSPRRIAATVMRVRRRISSSAIVRPTAGRALGQRDPVDEEVADDGLDLLDHRRLEVGAAEDRAEGAGLRVGERDRRGRSPPPRVEDVEVSPTGVVDDDDDVPPSAACSS